jgi:signal transduction histidine kinase
MLLRIFDNLISNALKHGEGDLTISVDCTERIQIRFENTLLSPNIDTEHIFDEFYTTDISRTKGNTGLGLAIAKQFTEMLGGSISAETAGRTFRVMVVFDAD